MLKVKIGCVKIVIICGLSLCADNICEKKKSATIVVTPLILIW